MSKKCPVCGKVLSSSDYGWYCSNRKCPLYNKDFMAFENVNVIEDMKKYMKRKGIKKVF